MAGGDDSNLWIVGVVLIILGSVGQNLGQNIVSLGHKETQISQQKKYTEECNSPSRSPKKDNIPDAEQQKVFDEIDKEIEERFKLEEAKNARLRTGGTLMFVFGALFTFAAFGFAAQSLLASLESVQFVANVIFAKLVHKEVISYKMIFATVSIIVGNTLVVIFSHHGLYLFTGHDIVYLYETNTSYQIYLGCALFIFLMSQYTYHKYREARFKLGKLYWNHVFIEPFAYVISSTIIGTLAVLNSKCLSMLIQVSVRGISNEFSQATVYVVLVTWGLLVAFWLRRMDLGLELYPPLFIIPVLQVFFVLFAILCGGIYFNEFLMFSTEQWIGFIIGVTMILLGVYGLTPDNVDILNFGSKVVPVDNDEFLDPSQGQKLETPQVEDKMILQRSSSGNTDVEGKVNKDIEIGETNNLNINHENVNSMEEHVIPLSLLNPASIDDPVKNSDSILDAPVNSKALSRKVINRQQSNVIKADGQ